MLVVLGILLALIPAVVILYPFFRGKASGEVLVDEPSPSEELRRRWDNALAGLRNTELERALDNLSEEDYLWLREQYMTEAALIMKALELEQQQEEEMLASIETEIRLVRQRALGSSSAEELPRTQDPSPEAAND